MRRALIACALAAAALSTAACGAGSAGNALQSVASAATKTAGIHTEKFHLDLAETVGPVGPLHVTADGSADNSTASVDATMNLSSVAALAGGTGGSSSEWQAHVILDGSGPSPILYLSLPALQPRLQGKTWLEADVGKLAANAGVDLGRLLETVGNEDPTKALQLLQSVGSVSKVGTATVDGVGTTEYSGTIDVQKAVAALGPAGSKLLGQSKVATIPVDVWIGGDGLVRRMHTTLSASVHGMQTVSDLTLDLSDFGTQVTITPPPAGQTLDITQLKGAKA